MTDLLDPAVLAVRPQPLGAFPLPLGYLLIPASPETEDARLALLAGQLPEWPAALRSHELALSGDRDGALAQLTGDDPITRYNRFVMDPDSDDPAELRSTLGEFGVLVDVVLYAIGHSDTAPEVGDLTGELAAIALSAQASTALHNGDEAGAVALLDRAADEAATVSEPLRGVLLGASASVADGPDAVSRFERALKSLDGAEGLRITRAELHLTLAGLLHEQAGDRPDLLARAVPHYHSALQLVMREEAPLLWASAHANLATAYLTMPMVEASSQLRLGVAAQSLRSAPGWDTATGCGTSAPASPRSRTICRPRHVAATRSPCACVAAAPPMHPSPTRPATSSAPRGATRPRRGSRSSRRCPACPLQR